MKIIGKSGSNYILEANVSELHRLNNMENNRYLPQDPPIVTEFILSLKTENALNDFKRITSSSVFSELRKEVNGLQDKLRRVQELHEKIIK